MGGPRGWHSRGYLPHFDGGEVPQFITFHLADAIPAAVARAWQAEVARLPPAEHKTQLYRRAEVYLDKGAGGAFLRDRRIASLVEGGIIHLHALRYTLYAWVVMPTHVHVLFTPFAEYSLSAIMHSLKSYTASRANRILNRRGRFWNEDYFDRYIRNARHFDATVAYIEHNPVAAGLAEAEEEWPFGSAYAAHGWGDALDCEHPCSQCGVT